MKALGIAVFAILLSACAVPVKEAEAQAGFFPGGWLPGDAITYTSFCLTEESISKGVAMFVMKKPTQGLALPVGCYTHGMAPGVLLEKITTGVDWDNDVFSVWTVRDIFRKEIYVIFWERGSHPYPQWHVSI